MAATRANTLEATADRLLRQALDAQTFETQAGETSRLSRLDDSPTKLAGEAASARDEEQEPTDAELAELSAEEEDALYGKGAGQYGGADGAKMRSRATCTIFAASLCSPMTKN